jgi:voltage-gated potassium channel
MAHAVLRPTVLKFLEMAFTDENTDIQVEEIAIQPQSRFAEKTLLEGGLRKGLNIIVIFIKKKDGSLVFNPGPDSLIQSNDTLVVVGSEDNIKSLGKLAAP